MNHSIKARSTDVRATDCVCTATIQSCTTPLDNVFFLGVDFMSVFRLELLRGEGRVMVASSLRSQAFQHGVCQGAGSLTICFFVQSNDIDSSLWYSARHIAARRLKSAPGTQDGRKRTVTVYDQSVDSCIGKDLQMGKISTSHPRGLKIS